MPRSGTTEKATAFRPWNKVRKERGLQPRAAPNYRHLFVSRAKRYSRHVNDIAPQEVRTYFITTVTANRRRLFQVESNAQLLFELLNEDRAKGRYQVHAFVFMPDHIHLLLTPAPNVSVEKAVQFVKGGFSFRLKSKMPVWENSFKKLGMKDPASYDNHRDYIHQNPVRAGLCERREEFPWSSANRVFMLDAAPAHLRA